MKIFDSRTGRLAVALALIWAVLFLAWMTGK